MTPAPTGDQPQQGLNLEKIDNLDDLLNNLGRVIPAKANSASEAKAEPPKEEPKSQFVKKRFGLVYLTHNSMPKLSIATNVVEISIAPKV